MVKKFCNTDDWKVFTERFNEWSKTKMQEYLQLDRAQDIELLQDRTDAISVLREDVESPRQLIQKIQSIFADAAHGGVILATIHKSKGLEAARVVFLDYKNVPHPMAHKAANKEHALRQEYNLKYVAITRAKHTLVMQDWEKTS